MPRYAIFYGYLGSYLRGVPKQGLAADYESVEGLMEAALKRFPVQNTPEFKFSSRTDQGVHALRTCGHVDLVHQKEGWELEPESLVSGMNRFFKNCMRPIRVIEVKKVCDSFNARHCAVSRTYIYRFAVLKDDFDNNKWALPSALPVTELNRCPVFKAPFDESKAKAVCNLFVGTKDFATFSRGPNKNEIIKREESGIVKSNIRKVYDCRIDPGVPFVVTPAHVHVPYDVWNFTVKASGFLYNMVRRMVGAVVAVGRGTMGVDDVQWMLENPSYKNWNSRAATASSSGLFLVDVEYDPRSFTEGYVPEKPWSQTVYSKPPTQEKDDLWSKLEKDALKGRLPIGVYRR